MASPATLHPGTDEGLLCLLREFQLGCDSRSGGTPA